MAEVDTAETTQATNGGEAAEVATSAGLNSAGSTSKGRGLPKLREGMVSSAKMDKTITVEVTIPKPHRRYKKFVKRTKKYVAHDETNQASAGDRVLIVECRPLSRRKRWRLREIIEKAA